MIPYPKIPNKKEGYGPGPNREGIWTIWSSAGKGFKVKRTKMFLDGAIDVNKAQAGEVERAWSCEIACF